MPKVRTKAKKEKVVKKTNRRRGSNKKKPATPDKASKSPEDAFPEPERVKGWTDKYVEAAGAMDGWAPASEVFDLVTSVSTVFPDFDRATTVGGLPVRRIHTLHGPTHEGKTVFGLGLVKSFADVGYLAGYIDAEHALGQEFADEIVSELALRPNFVAVRPNSYEETIHRVDDFLKHAAKARVKHPGAKSILVVDSINKLVPERELKKLLDQGKKGAEELAKAHHARYRAALNQAWLDKLTPQIAKAECALVIIAQERDDHENSTKFFDAFKVKGGKSLLFDASLVIRIMKAGAIYLPGAEKKNENIIGFRHRIRIWKSKVGHMTGRYTDAYFHLSNGKFSPAGLDTARDAVEVGVDLGIVKKSGTWLTYDSRRAQGHNKMIENLNKHPHRLTGLLDAIAAKLDKLEGRT